MKRRKKWQMQDSLSRHSFCLSRQNFKETKRAMSQPAAVFRNKVQVEFKEEEELCREKEYFCRDIAEKECEEDCHDTLYSVATLSKENGSGTLSRQSLLYRNIKG